MAECIANIENRVVDMRLANKFNLFILDVVKGWIDPSQKHPKTTHHNGYGKFIVDSEVIKLNSRVP